ncbi:translation initiation factor [Botrimarina hoheduenensis]|uniref:Translation initiation factor Sui1 n=1 Tax=Botrimarina hoheduenensis TaxID=2528000 RepID=A0A5C5WD46_9BACT|nr:translation initiation factor [Botrimarina hoheduenensis]TWT48600.1 translation initiation factor Sui1 [Botrimarina hoheduenensis]
MAGLFDGTPLERPVRCEECGQLVQSCVCPPKVAPQPPAEQQHPRVRRERRRGKWTTVIAGLTLPKEEQKALLKQLQAELGVGGGVSEGELLLQGDHRDKVVERLRGRGYQAKSSGG